MKDMKDAFKSYQAFLRTQSKLYIQDVSLVDSHGEKPWAELGILALVTHP